MEKLSKETAQAWWVEQLQQPLDEERQQMLNAYMDEHPDEAAEFEADASLWETLGKLDTPSPSTAMDRKFEDMLQAHRVEEQTISSQSGARAYWQVGIAAAIAGFIIGFLLIPKPTNDVDQLTAEVQEMKKLMMLTMIEKPQAQERIKAVNMVNEAPKNDQKITSALLTTLESDPSINVRLAALESLINYGDQAYVRSALVESIARARVAADASSTG